MFLVVGKVEFNSIAYFNLDYPEHDGSMVKIKLADLSLCGKTNRISNNCQAVRSGAYKLTAFERKNKCYTVRKECVFLGCMLKTVFEQPQYQFIKPSGNFSINKDYRNRFKHLFENLGYGNLTAKEAISHVFFYSASKSGNFLAYFSRRVRNQRLHQLIDTDSNYLLALGFNYHWKKVLGPVLNDLYNQKEAQAVLGKAGIAALEGNASSKGVMSHGSYEKGTLSDLIRFITNLWRHPDYVHEPELVHLLGDVNDDVKFMEFWQNLFPALVVTAWNLAVKYSILPDSKNIFKTRSKIVGDLTFEYGDFEVLEIDSEDSEFEMEEMDQN